MIVNSDGDTVALLANVWRQTQILDSGLYVMDNYLFVNGEKYYMSEDIDKTLWVDNGDGTRTRTIDGLTFTRVKTSKSYPNYVISQIDASHFKISLYVGSSQNNFYPLNAIYGTTKKSDDPNTLFGGAWARLGITTTSDNTRVYQWKRVA